MHPSAARIAPQRRRIDPGGPPRPVRRRVPSAAAPRTQAKSSWFGEHGGTLVLLFLVCCFGAYMLDTGGMRGSIDGIFAGFNRTAHTHDAQVASGFIAALPFVVLMLGLALTWILFGGFGRKRKKGAGTEPAGEQTLHEFAEGARHRAICAKVARAAYRELCPQYGPRMRGLLDQQLRAGLGLDDAAVAALFTTLLSRSDRPAGKRFARSAERTETLLDLLRAADALPDMVWALRSRAEADAPATSLPQPRAARAGEAVVLR